MCYMFLPGDMDLLQKIENMNPCIISLILIGFKALRLTATTKSLIKDLEGYIKTVMHHFFFFRKLLVSSLA